MRCIFHGSDFDGIGSAAIIKAKYPDIQLCPINYGDEFPWEDIETGEHVVMVDFSLPLFDMLRLNKLTKLIWIDHHVSAINEYQYFFNNLPLYLHPKNATTKNGIIAREELTKIYGDITGYSMDELQLMIVLQGLRKVGEGAISLTWKFFNPNLPVPLGIKLLSDYDIWALNDDVLNFQYGLRCIDSAFTPDGEIWRDILSQNAKVLNHINDKGEVIRNYITNDYAKICYNSAFETEFEGLRAIAINRGGTSSQLFDSIWDESKYDLMITFCRNKGKWRVSLYATSDAIDCSILAKKYKGGGHKSSAGFVCAKLPFAF